MLKLQVSHASLALRSWWTANNDLSLLLLSVESQMKGCASAIACLGYSEVEKPTSDSADANDNITWYVMRASIIDAGVVNEIVSPVWVIRQCCPKSLRCCHRAICDDEFRVELYVSVRKFPVVTFPVESFCLCDQLASLLRKFRLETCSIGENTRQCSAIKLPCYWCTVTSADYIFMTSVRDSFSEIARMTCTAWCPAVIYTL